MDGLFANIGKPKGNKNWSRPSAGRPARPEGQYSSLYMIDLPTADGRMLDVMGDLPYNRVPKLGISEGVTSDKAIRSYLKSVLGYNTNVFALVASQLRGLTGYPGKFAHHVPSLEVEGGNYDDVLTAYEMAVAEELAHRAEGWTDPGEHMARARALVERSGLRKRLEHGKSGYLFPALSLEHGVSPLSREELARVNEEDTPF